VVLTRLPRRFALPVGNFLASSSFDPPLFLPFSAPRKGARRSNPPFVCEGPNFGGPLCPRCRVAPPDLSRGGNACGATQRDAARSPSVFFSEQADLVHDRLDPGVLHQAVAFGAGGPMDVSRVLFYACENPAPLFLFRPTKTRC